MALKDAVIPTFSTHHMCQRDVQGSRIQSTMYTYKSCIYDIYIPVVYTEWLSEVIVTYDDHSTHGRQTYKTYTLPKANRSHLRIGRLPQKETHLSTIHF